MAVATCGGPVIPFRAGRVDVWAGGPTGAPEPQHDLPTLTESFRKQGFNQAEMIKLVACGHTLGGVRSSDFPLLVPPDPNSASPVFNDFDSTMAFDNTVSAFPPFYSPSQKLNVCSQCNPIPRRLDKEYSCRWHKSNHELRSASIPE